MGVIAVRTIAGVQIQHEFECSTFDFMVASDPSTPWQEIARDCDRWKRRTLYPYASGPRYNNNTIFGLSDKMKFRKYFPQPSDDTAVVLLDMSDTNAGLLPATHCTWLEVVQNGKKLPCEAYTIDFSAATITILDEWAVPGAAYEVLFFAQVST